MINIVIGFVERNSRRVKLSSDLGVKAHVLFRDVRSTVCKIFDMSKSQ